MLPLSSGLISKPSMMQATSKANGLQKHGITQKQKEHWKSTF
jgi:hypothetical protein